VLGGTANDELGGLYFNPTLVLNPAPGSEIVTAEIFGPVLCMQTFSSDEEAVQMANDHVYGLQASIWTRDINCAHGVARALRAGTVHVNQYDEDDITVPFGGYKQSGVGRDKSLHAFDKYTELKTTWIRIDSPV
jgi:acyl-CoA reductase-like NAD-dependent aldehyde dehydrogenase